MGNLLNEYFLNRGSIGFKILKIFYITIGSSDPWLYIFRFTYGQHNDDDAPIKRDIQDVIIVS